MRQKTTKIKLRLRTSTKPTDTTHYTSNTFFQTLHTLPTHFQHLCRYTRPFFSVDDAQRKSFASKQIKQITMCWGPKCYIVPIPSLLHTTSLRLHLCLLYPSHPRAFPNMHSFPSNSFPPPSPPFTPNTAARLSAERLGKLSTSFFGVFLAVFL